VDGVAVAHDTGGGIDGDCGGWGGGRGEERVGDGGVDAGGGCGGGEEGEEDEEVGHVLGRGGWGGVVVVVWVDLSVVEGLEAAIMRCGGFCGWRGRGGRLCTVVKYECSLNGNNCSCS